MTNRQTIKINQFLKEREGRYHPKDPAVHSLKRLNKIDFSGEIHLSDKGSKTDMIIIEPGDLVISGINVSKGALAVYHGDEPITATIHYSSYIFDKKMIDIEYFKRFVKSQSFVMILKEQVKGGIKTEIKPKHFLRFGIHLPNIDSQREIVSFFGRIENDMGELNNEISCQQSYLKELRQQILQEAIEGKITAEWRKQNPELIGGENHVSKLLKKIEIEKERLIKEGKIKKNKPYPLITDDKMPFILPRGWVWCRLGFCSINRDDTRKPISQAERERKEKVYPYYGASGIIDKIDGYTHQGKNLLIGEDGANLVARSTAIAFIADGKYWVNNHAHVIGFLDEITLMFVEIYINAIDLKPYITGGFQPKLSQGNLNLIYIAFPPLAEQQAIVERVEKLMAMIDELEKQVTERKNQSEMLMQSVLREAFTE